jgi:aspartyl-tRNA(Asn)/glutamyl-tRNA(Gln) amidotransferase subunit C
MPITRQDVIHVATLARLDLDSDAIETHVTRIAEILDYMTQLDGVDTSGVQATSHAIERTNAFREDQRRASLETDQAMANAPQREDGQFVVPKIVG